MSIAPYLITATVAYLLGSIPFGYLLVRLFRHEDVRASGSGNIGATNVARKSPLLGAVTLLLDAGKGLAAVLVPRVLFEGQHHQLLLTTAAFFAVLGHLFPVWLKFRGGKGVATSLGAFILLTPKSILCMVLLFVLIAGAFRYVSLGSVVVASAFPLLAWTFREYADSRQLILMAVVSLLVIWKHRHNLGRLAAGTETKLGKKSETDSGSLGATRR
jgi:glycerol-3-phosphate acyltransferase PlsY